MERTRPEPATAEIDPKEYPRLAAFTAPMPVPEREIVGRGEEMMELQAAMSRPELCNALLLAQPGTGKTALVQGTMMVDTDRVYLEVDLAKMSADSEGTTMATRLKGMFDEAEALCRVTGIELVLFIDEAHQIVQMSDAAVEALKPVLAASGTRGIRVVFATTFEEFHQFIAPNQALMERLQRINIEPPDRRTTIQILRGMAQRYGVADKFYDDHLFELIYEYTNRYVPAGSQPRKSILMLDSMVGWHRQTGHAMDRKLLANVIYRSTGINVAFRVDAVDIKKNLDKKVFGQQMATTVISRRLQLCVADLNDKTRPMSSFLFAGSTGVGKTELTKQLAALLFGDAQNHLIRFDMSEYSQPESVDVFRQELARKVWDTPFCVLLLDEIEKASSTVTKLLLQVLDDGRLSDANGRQVSFLNSYVVMTTNAGSEIYKKLAAYAADDDGSGKKMARYMPNIRRSLTATTAGSFPPELVGRIDEIVPFQPLTMRTKRQIVENKLRALRKDLLVKHDVRLKVDPSVVEYLVENRSTDDTDAGGAREAINLLNNQVITEIAAFVNAHPHERVLGVKIDGELASRNKNKLESNVDIVVVPVR